LLRKEKNTRAGTAVTDGHTSKFMTLLFISLKLLYCLCAVGVN